MTTNTTDLSPLTKLLTEINDQFAKKEVYPILVNGNLANSNSYTYRFEQTLRLNPNATHRIYLKSFSAWQNIPNIYLGQNSNFTYIVPAGTASNTSSSPVSKSISIPQGAYQISDINNYIQLQMQVNGDWISTANAANPYYIVISINLPTQQVLITLYSGFKVDFTQVNSINPLLGFNSRILSGSLNYSDSLVDINPIQNISIYCSICTGFYYSGRQSNILYSFPNSTSAGFMITESPNPVLPCLVNTKNIDYIMFSFASESGFPLTFQGEEFTIVLVIEQV
jgi:hypothetical protein